MRRVTVLVYALLVPIVSFASETSSDCLARKYGNYALAKEKWQRAVTELIVGVAPEYKEVAEIYLRDQLRAIERAKIAVEFLAREELERLRIGMSLNNWLALDESLRQRVAANEQRYARLLELQKAALRRAPHPDGDGLRQLMRSEIAASDEYRALLKTFSKTVREIEDSQCQKSITNR
ncbi:hypothetical protein [Thiohalomonas denitrificans]|uniref:Uncharacterized protein n=1 Tax=Thiohalomonas denitrificans TaxID=415747 RepID=A0A1G5PRJ9_9GAMM|nr:hypothetical protein [Thiohalomonas denitrificans]SCZ52275.1 hypothetical protein SAMN03097708_00714 [Thiohalomonas denitrificans]